MYKFDLSEFEKIELENCDSDIKEKFEKLGGGYSSLLPTLIQFNRNLNQLNQNFKLLFEKCISSKQCTGNSKES